MDNIKRCAVCLICLLVMASCLCIKARAAEPAIAARAAALIDMSTGKVIFEKNGSMQLPMASTTKIMTTLLTLEAGDLDSYFEVDPNAIKVEGSSMGLKEGCLVTRRMLAYGMMLPSGNDAANSAAVSVAGSIDDFVRMMNDRAAQMGLDNTHFVTPSGLDDYTSDHYSTALDMAYLTANALKNETFKQVCQTRSIKLEFGDGKEFWLANTNRLLDSCEGVIGVKTGFTDKAGRCLVSACTRNGVTLICVTLNDPNDWYDHTNLYDYGFGMYENCEFGGVSLKIPCASAENGGFVVASSDGFELPLMECDYPRVERLVLLPRFVYRDGMCDECNDDEPVEPVSVGRVIYLLDGCIIAQKELYIR